MIARGIVHSGSTIIRAVSKLKQQNPRDSIRSEFKIREIKIRIRA